MSRGGHFLAGKLAGGVDLLLTGTTCLICQLLLLETPYAELCREWLHFSFDGKLMNTMLEGDVHRTDLSLQTDEDSH